MARGPIAKLGGVPLSIRRGESISWSLRGGVDPVQRTFAVSKDRAKQILARAQAQFAPTGESGSTRTRGQAPTSGPLTLEIRQPGYKPLIVHNLYAAHLTAVDENRLGVVVVDCRWLLRNRGNSHVVREYNMRRATGDRILVGNELVPIQVRDTQPDVVYRRITLKGGERPWKAKEVLEDILTQLVGTNGFRIEGGLTLSVDVNDLQIDDPGARALEYVLGYLPGAGVYCGLDGKLVIYNTLGGAETRMLRIAGNPYPGSQVELIDKSLIRPRNVISLFDYEPEIRFDYTEGSRPTRTAGREPRELEQVFPVVDPSLTLNGKTVAEGSWLEGQDWLDAISALNDYPGSANGRSAKETLGPLTYALIRKHYLSGFQHLRNKFILAEQGLADPLWMKRLAAAEQFFRSGFRPTPAWMDKVKSVRAYRAAITDQETGSRGKAEAFFNATIRPSFRTLAKTKNDNSTGSFDFTGYADLVADASPGPADVVMLQPEAGVFQLKFKADPWGIGAKVAPGTLLNNLSPLQSAGELALAWNSTKVELAPSWQMSVILTVQLAAPNDQSRLHAESVGINKALSLLPPGGTKSTKALGPDYTVRTKPGIQTVRCAWLDDYATQIEEAVFTGKPWPQETIVNLQHIRSIAAANAARVQALFLDRHQGEQIVSINPDVKPAGALFQVTHSYVWDGVDGTAVTQMILPPFAVAPDLGALLPDSTRKLLNRSVQD